MKLLSCSMGNTQFKFSERFRSVKPINSTTCECYDDTHARCIAWCTMLPINNFEIVESNSSGIFTVSCPFGKKVLGCHIDPMMYSGGDTIRDFYPTNNGTNCMCSDVVAANCIATCASNLANYEIVNVSGVKHVNVQCTHPDNKVLGCGGSPIKDPASFEKWRAIQVYNETSCTCYDWYGINCYAICGKFW